MTLAELTEGFDGLSSGDDLSWDLAANYHALMQQCQHDPARAMALTREAAEAIIRRAHQIIHSASPRKRMVREPWTQPGRGEILEEESIESLIGRPMPTAEDLIVGMLEPRDIDVALMLDTSFSMTGPKFALSCVAAVVLACKSPGHRYCIVEFHSGAEVVKPLGEALTLRALVQRLLRQTMFGYTNLEAALRTGLTAIARSRGRGRRVGVIITDGNPTAGGDPLPWAARFDALHVIMAEDGNMDRQMCRALAARGRGRLFPLARFEDLPRVFYTALRTVTR